MQTFFVDNFQLKICLLSSDMRVASGRAGFFRLGRSSAFWEKDGNEGVLKRKIKRDNTIFTQKMCFSSAKSLYNFFQLHCQSLIVSNNIDVSAQVCLTFVGMVQAFR